MTGPTVTIDQALEAFLAVQRERLSERTCWNYDCVVELLRDSRNGYAYDTLGAEDRARWEAAFEAGDEDAYCHLSPPDHIPAHTSARGDSTESVGSRYFWMGRVGLEPTTLGLKVRSG